MAKRLFMEDNGYPCAPVNISDELWFYPEPKGMHIVTHPGGGRGRIPWAKVAKALDDHKKAKSRRLRK